SVNLRSTVFIQAQPGGDMSVSGLEGLATIEAFGEKRYVLPGTQVKIPLDQNLAASGPPGPTEPYDFSTFGSVPTDNLNQSVVSLPAETLEEILVQLATAVAGRWHQKATQVSRQCNSDALANLTVAQERTLNLAVSDDGSSLRVLGQTFNRVGD